MSDILMQVRSTITTPWNVSKRNHLTNTDITVEQLLASSLTNTDMIMLKNDIIFYLRTNADIIIKQMLTKIPTSSLNKYRLNRKTNDDVIMKRIMLST